MAPAVGRTPYAGRGRPRWPRLLALGMLVVAVLEVAVIVLVARLVGGWPTVLLLLLTSAAGWWLVRREGVKAWRSLRAASAAGQVPSRELADAVLVLLGGVLLLLPGFVTDVVGALVLLPVTRPFARALLTGLVGRGVLARFGGWRGPGGGGGGPDVIEGEVL